MTALLEMSSFLYRRNGATPVIEDYFFPFLGKSRAKNERLGAYPGAAETTSLTRIGHSEKSNAVVIKSAGYRFEAMPVCPGLDNRH